MYKYITNVKYDANNMCSDAVNNGTIHSKDDEYLSITTTKQLIHRTFSTCEQIFCTEQITFKRQVDVCIFRPSTNPLFFQR